MLKCRKCDGFASMGALCGACRRRFMTSMEMHMDVAIGQWPEDELDGGATDDSIVAIGPVVCEVTRHYPNGANCPKIARPQVGLFRFHPFLTTAYVLTVLAMVAGYLWIQMPGTGIMMGMD